MRVMVGAGDGAGLLGGGGRWAAAMPGAIMLERCAALCSVWADPGRGNRKAGDSFDKEPNLTRDHRAFLIS